MVQGVVGAGTVRIENLTFYGSALPTQPAQKMDEGAIPPCPYPGLAYFGPQDSALFFGRDAAIARLEAAVARRTLMALVGASGSGKSSVVLAGLAPRLHAQGGWRFSHFRVGTEADKNPFLALARALVPLLGERGITEQLEEVHKLAVKLNSGAVDLPNAIGACRAANPGKRILLIADQFEEVFTLVGDEGLQKRFIDALLASFPDRADGNPPDICLVLTLRADFYGMALRHRPLADALQGRVENLGPMTRDELREAITRPAGLVTFESGLVETLLDDVTSRPGSLPLLQFALREMWGHLDKPCMTRADYDAIGGVEGALAKRAQAIYERETKKGEDTRAVMLFRRLFTRLVTLRQDTEDTRRTVGSQELGPEAWQLAQRLAGQDNRLVVTSAPAPDHETAEVVHEALIRNWPALTEWVKLDRDFQSWLRQLQPQLDEWRKHPQDEGTLLRGGPLTVAEEWLQRRRDEVSENERNYIDLSVKHKRLAQRRRLRVQALVSVLVVAILAGLTAWWYQRPLTKLAWPYVLVMKENIYWLTDVRGHLLTAEQAHVRTPSAPPFKECTDCPEMVLVPAGKFVMGSPRDGPVEEHPPHEVTIARAFAVSKFELTFDEWDACVAHGDCDVDKEAHDWGRGRQPVINVSWDDAQRYVAWLSRITGKTYRLLTEAEWEYAARGGKQTTYSWGDEIGTNNANCASCGSEWDSKSSAAVGSFAANAFGLYDMHGNVWEWVEDCYDDNYDGAPTDGSARTGAECDRAVRGGSWLAGPQYIRSASRSGIQPSLRDRSIGFRVARTF